MNPAHLGLDVSDVRRQLLACLRQRTLLEALHVAGGRPRPCTLAHVLSGAGDDQELAQLTPLRVTYTDETGGTVLWTWRDAYAYVYVKESPLDMMILQDFAFQPKVFSTAPSLGDTDATPAEVVRALHALSGASTPVLATTESDDGTEQRARMALTPVWNEDSDSDDAAMRLEISPVPAGEDDRDGDSPPPVPLGLGTVCAMINTGNMVAPDVVRHIQVERAAASADA